MEEKNKEYYEFSNDIYHRRPEFKIRFEIYKSYNERIAIYKRTKDNIHQIGLGSLTTNDKWSVRWYSPKKEKYYSNYFTTLKAAKNHANELVNTLQ